MSQCSVALLLYIVDHRRSYMCRFVRNARLCGGITSVGFCLPSRVAHSLVYILPDCHGIVALLVSSGKQPWSELLHTLRFICVCCVGHLSASVQILFTSLPHQAVLLLLVFDRSRCQSSRLASRGTASPTCQGVTNDNPYQKGPYSCGERREDLSSN